MIGTFSLNYVFGVLISQLYKVNSSLVSSLWTETIISNLCSKRITPDVKENLTMSRSGLMPSFLKDGYFIGEIISTN